MKNSIFRPIGCAALFIVLFLSGCGGEDPPAVPEPIDLGRDDIAAYAVIPDLDAAMRGIVAFAEVIEPGSLTLEELRSEVGQMLGDPKLESLDTSDPLLLMVMKGDPTAFPPPLVALIPTGKESPAAESLARLGMQTKHDGTLLLASTVPGLLEEANSFGGFYDRLADAGIAASGRVYFHIGHLLEDYGALLDAQIDTFLSMMGLLPGMFRGGSDGEGGMSGLQTILKLEIEALLSIVRQCESVQLDLSVGKSGIQIDKVVAARKDSALAGLFEKSASLEPASFGVSDGSEAFRAVFSMEGEGTRRLIEDVIAEMRKDEECAALIDSSFAEMFVDMGSWWPDRATFVVDATGEAPIGYRAVAEIDDPESYLAAMEKFATLAAPGSSIHEFYKSAGITMDWKMERDVRTHAGFPIHRVRMFGEIDDTVPGFEAFAAVPTTIELAVMDKKVAMACVPEELDSLVDRVREGKSGSDLDLEAVRVFGANRQMYFDYDIIGLMKNFGGVIPGAEGAFESMSAGHPMVAAVTFHENRALIQLRLPMGIFQEFKKAGR